VEGHVRQHHGVLEHGKDAVHAWFAVGVVPPIAVHRQQYGDKVGDQTIPLVLQRLLLQTGYLSLLSTRGEQVVGDDQVDSREEQEGTKA